MKRRGQREFPPSHPLHQPEGERAGEKRRGGCYHRHSLAIASARHLLLRCALLCSPDAEGLVEWG